jgi:DNA polymerase III alpha subunit
MKDRLYLPSENAQPLLPCLRHCPIVLTSQVQSNIPTVELSGRLSFELHDLGYEFPRYPVPDEETMDSFLRKRVAEGVIKRYGPKNNRALTERAKE